MMYSKYSRFTLLILVAFVSAWSLPGAAPSDAGSEQAGQKQNQEQKESKPKDSGASLTGCVDEQDGHYVMISEQTRDLIADLQADGFETEGFAKHVGHKVTVRGISNPGTTRPLFRVRSIEKISDSCATHSLI
jgi:hypothetical protein